MLTSSEYGEEDRGKGLSHTLARALLLRRRGPRCCGAPSGPLSNDHSSDKTN